jgi:predicted acetyltransferase
MSGRDPRMLDLDVSLPSDDGELARYGEMALRSLGLPASRVPSFVGRLDPATVRVARQGTDVVGGLVALPMGHWFGGRAVPSRGITAVGVAAEHRSRGIASELLRTALEEARRDGVALSSLFPATFPVYRAAGYESAGNRIVYRVALSTVGAGAREPDVHRATPDDHPTMRALYDERSRSTSGAVDRTTYFWRRIFEPPSGDETVPYIVRGASGPEGYVVLSQRSASAPLEPIDIAVVDVVARTAAAGRRIVRMLADHRSIASHARWASGPGDPLLLLLREERLEVTTVQRWMLRIVDVRAALEKRGWPATATAEIHLDVRDPLLRENARRWVLEVDRGRVSVREGGSGGIAMDVRGLAALYSGFLSAEELRVAGLCDGDDAELARASAVFAGPAPWTADFF